MPGEARSYRRLLLDRQFGPFVGAALLSNIGNWFHVVTSVIVVHELTGSAFMVGLISFANFAAFLVLTPLAGVVTDRTSRRRVLVLAQSGSALAAAGLAITFLIGHGSAVGVLVASLLLGVGSVFSIPATLSVVPELVPPADHGAGLALNTISINVARMVGPVLGAFVLTQAGAGPAFAVNAASFAVYALVCRRLPIPAAVATTTRVDGRYRVALRAVRCNRELRAAFGCVVVVGVLLEPNTTLAPALAEAVGSSESLVGFVVGAFGAGALLGAPMAKRPRILCMPTARAGFAFAAGGTAAIMLAPHPAALLAGFGLLGAGYLAAVTALTTQIQVAVPIVLRGRVMALWSQLLLGVRPISSVVLGGLTDLASVRVASAALLVLAVVGWSLAGRPPRAL
ncbi:MFS transporter [Egicoccus sp. AB-alg2]|uniref:MFS transporter n=1 Tax=Egicoccus sp. AB-alg2 TaxID=3242693 RepID=UPI00359CC42E